MNYFKNNLARIFKRAQILTKLKLFIRFSKNPLVQFDKRKSYLIRVKNKKRFVRFIIQIGDGIRAGTLLG